MKILLINPYCLDPRLQDYDIKIVPIGLYYIGATLMKAGHRVEILNWYGAKGKSSEMAQKFADFLPDIIGISILHANRWGGIDIARIAKEVNPDTKIIFGGVGATFLWRHLLEHFQEIDIIVLGEGEKTFLQLVDVIKEEAWHRLDKIPGIAFRKGGRSFKNKSADLIDDIDSLPDPSEYFRFEHITSSRGCPWNCTFCGSPRFWKRKVRFHSPEYFVGQMERLRRRGVKFFYVSDDTFTLKKDRVIRICQLILEKRLDVSWVAISRVNYIDEEILYWMRRAGCIQISYGVESGSERIRKVFNKGITRKQIIRAFHTTQRFGILARAYFIYGAPGETPKTIGQSIELMDEIRPLSCVFYILDLFPGTALYDEFCKKAKITDDFWLQRIEDIMYFQTDPRLSSEEILAFGRRLRHHYYRNLANYARSIELADIQELYPLHSDFCSRLAMTFAFGDYARIEEIPEREEIAESLFLKALEYHPDHRAFLGLGILRQKHGQYKESVSILENGLDKFPGSHEIHNCLGVSLINMGRFSEALDHFLRFPRSPQSLQYAAQCYKALGQSENEAAALDALKKIAQQS